MKIAITYKDGNVFQHFGHTEHFKVYDVENGKVVISTIINTNGSGHGALADILKKCNVEKLICGGIGAGAKDALTESGIEFFPGVTGNADEQIEAYLAGTLNYNPNTECEHHKHDTEGGHHKHDNK